MIRVVDVFYDVIGFFRSGDLEFAVLFDGGVDGIWVAHPAIEAPRMSQRMAWHRRPLCQLEATTSSC